MPLFSRSLYLAVFLFVIGEVTLPLSLANEPALPLVHSLFCDHMVLQRDQLVPVWGWAKPGTQVSVSINGQSTETTVGGDGKWRVAMGPLAAGGPHTMTISGPESVTINDVLVGDVWICSGQSNMQWPVSSSNNADQEVANASYEKIRLFGVPRRISASPESTVDAAWQICSPESIGSFSAVGYFFGRDLHQKLEVPIGLIHSSWGGTVAEAWTSAETLETMDDFRDALKEVKDKVGLDESVERRREETQRIAAWWKKNNATKHDWRSSDFDDSAWKSLQMPQYWDNVDETMKNFDGIVRFRCSFELDEADIDKDLQLALGAIDDVDDTWVNGVRVGGLPQHDKQRNYKVSRQFLIPGPNILSISIYDSGGHGGINATGATFAATIGDREISLAGDWKYEVAAEKKKLSRFPRVDRNNPNIVTVLYNGMIAPLGPFGIRGAIWYQGESNASRPIQYRPLLSRMIGNWRSQFENDKFPFLIVQLANYKKLQTEPVESGWAEIRESQQRIADADPYVGITVITDIGDADDIHPRNKQDVGKRLALSAMSIAYGRDLVSSGPIYRSHQINGQEVRLQLDCADGGLDVRGDQILGFAIAGDDGNYVWAEATLDGNEVVLTAPKGMAPKSIRYNWADNPIGNLFNKQGLPTAPFRTDVPE